MLSFPPSGPPLRPRFRYHRLCIPLHSVNMHNLNSWGRKCKEGDPQMEEKLPPFPNIYRFFSETQLIKRRKATGGKRKLGRFIFLQAFRLCVGQPVAFPT